MADIVAKTMDKYLLYGRQLAVKVVPKDELKGRQLFKYLICLALISE